MANPVDQFSGGGALNSPATDAVPVTPSDTVGLTAIPRALLIGTAGTIKVMTWAAFEGGTGVAVTLTVPAGILPLRVAQIFSTGTTAANIAALY